MLTARAETLRCRKQKRHSSSSKQQQQQHPYPFRLKVESTRPHNRDVRLTDPSWSS